MKKMIFAITMSFVSLSAFAAEQKTGIICAETTTASIGDVASSLNQRLADYNVNVSNGNYVSVWEISAPTIVFDAHRNTKVMCVSVFKR